MKKLWMVLAISALGLRTEAQQNMQFDSLRKNELSFNIAPVIMTLAGGMSENTHINFSLGYRRYLNEKHIFRSALVVFPNANEIYNNGLMLYDRRVDDRVVFKTSNSGGGMKWQLNLGMERIYRMNRLTHGLGGEIFVNTRNCYRSDDYYHFSDTINSPNFTPYIDFSKYLVDSLGYVNKGKEVGGGLHMFYTIRYKISKHWYLSGTIGPSVNVASYKGRFYDRRTKEEKDISSFSFDFPNVPLISDVSIAFRF